MTEQTPSVGPQALPTEILIEWTEPETVVFTNQLAASTDGNVVFLTFGQAVPPIMPMTVTALGQPPKPVQPTKVRVQATTRVVMTPQVLRAVIQSLQQMLELLERGPHAPPSAPDTHLGA